MISSPKTPVERLLWAYQFGHAWNRDPKYANLRNLDVGRVKSMNGSESDAKLLIASWQDFDPNVEKLVSAYHRRDLQADGEWGPASEFAVNISRCAMTDFAPPDKADLSTDIWDDPDLLGAIVSYQRYAAFRNNDQEYEGGTGSWPGPKKGGGCDPQRKDVHSTRMNVLLAGFSSQQKAQWPEVAAAMVNSAAEVGLANRVVFDGDPNDCEHDVRGQGIPGNVIGYAYFPQPDTCNQVVVARIDNTFNVDKYTFGELNEHEEGGHSRGHEHQNRQSSTQGNDGYSIMHPAIGRPTRWMSWLKDRGFARMQKWFGGRPLPTAGPTPEPTPVPGPIGKTIWEQELPAGRYKLIQVGSNPPIVV